MSIEDSPERGVEKDQNSASSVSRECRSSGWGGPRPRADRPQGENAHGGRGQVSRYAKVLNPAKT